MHFLTAGGSVPTLMDYSNYETYITMNLANSIFLTPTNETEINDIIVSLKCSSASGYDDLKVAPIKAVKDWICSPLAHICNRILETGIFPNKMKLARVCIIHKGGTLTNLNNYRPISVLPLFSKIAEKVINTRFSKYFLYNNIITSCQYGFQKGKSTETALLCIKNKIISNIENRL